MCGIFGMLVRVDDIAFNTVAKRLLKDLFLLSESRGQEASGLAVMNDDSITVAKKPFPAGMFIRSPEWDKLTSRLLGDQNGAFRVAVGHSRLVTNGTHQIHANNQPVISAGIVAIHNGIVTNVDELWASNEKLEREHDIDTEVILKLVRKRVADCDSIPAAMCGAFRDIEGVANLALLFEDRDQLVLATNNGSLYLAYDLEKKNMVFASERKIVARLFERSYLSTLGQRFELQHIKAGSGILLNTLTGVRIDFSLGHQNGEKILYAVNQDRPRTVIDVSTSQNEKTPDRIPGQGPYLLSPSFKDHYPKNAETIANLRRCTRCVLPTTFPFIKFNKEGVCNYCQTYCKVEVLGIDQLREHLDLYRKRSDEPECIVALSGGRDSCFALHTIKREFGLNVIAYTYDWGIITDLARRNQMRLCGKLGVEHILVSANIAWKRSNIRKNVTAWLKKPDLGTIPLFMAGDKHYFSHANRIGKENKCKTVIMGENPLETTRFKVGFCGIPPEDGPTQNHNMSTFAKGRLVAYYAGAYFSNPAYINSSLLDTISAYIAYYLIPKNYLDIFRYIKWDEDAIISTLTKNYNWEVSPDCKSTWRIGDGTAPFYNYIYYTMAGFTENDTFRSNQIREGIISRDTALELVMRDNEPRYESMQWYCDVVGIDFYEAVKIINATEKLYKVGC